MKIKNSIFSLLLTMSVPAAGIGSLQSNTNGTNNVVTLSAETGTTTNDIHAVTYYRDGKIWVTISLTSDSADWAAFRFNTNRRDAEAYRFFMATNSFCGLIELRDDSTNSVPLRKPNVNNLNAYPPSYHLRQEQRLLMFKNGYGSYNGPGLPTALSHASSTLCSFNLMDYFEIKRAGKYSFIVWPKIYKRASRTNDLCERIDLPPTSVTFNWNGQNE